MKTGAAGELVPVRGFSRWKPTRPIPGQSVWRSHDTLRVISSLEEAYLGVR